MPSAPSTLFSGSPHVAYPCSPSGYGSPSSCFSDSPPSLYYSSSSSSSTSPVSPVSRGSPLYPIPAVRNDLDSRRETVPHNRFVLIEDHDTIPYVVVPHSKPEHKNSSRREIQFNRQITVDNRKVFSRGIDMQCPSRGLQNNTYKPFANASRGEGRTDRMNLYLEFPGRHLGQHAHDSAAARKVVATRDGQISLEDLAYVVYEFVNAELTKIQRYTGSVHSVHQQWMFVPSDRFGIKAQEITVSGLLEFKPGHWQVVLLWIPVVR